MKSLSDWNAKVGDLALPKWRALQSWARAQTFVPGPGILWRQGPDGIHVWAARPRGWEHPLRVRRSGDVVRVTPGTCDGKPVCMGDLALDGRPASDPAARRGEVPVLEITAPTEGAESWVAVRAGAETGTGRPEVVHLHEPDTRAQPLARLVWRDGAVVAVHQIVRHDLRSGPVAGGRVYWAV
jgi:hypothetical protein